MPVVPERAVVGETSVELVLGGIGREFEFVPVAIFLKLSASVAISCPGDTDVDVDVDVGFVVVELVVELVVESDLEPEGNLDVVELVVELVVVELDGGLGVVLVLVVFIVSIFSKSFDICEQAKQINMTNPSPNALLQFVVATNQTTNNNLPKIVRNKKFFEII